MRVPERLREAIRARAFSEGAPDALAVARAVVESGGAEVLGIVFFGSRKTRAGPDSWSGYDFFVLTHDYRSFYRSLKASGCMRRSAGLLAGLNTLLPPNQIRIPAITANGTAVAKCAVMSLRRFVQDTSERRHDHFCAGRLFQPTEVLYSRDESSARQILDALASAHATTLSWARPWLPALFDVETYCRSLLRLSLSYEIRPEPAGRLETLWQAQREYLLAIYGILLAELAQAGDLTSHADGRFSLARSVTWLETLRLSAYFRWSLVRATARWFKYIVTFEGWLDYILRKAQRHTGAEIVLTERERRLPILFLWPRLFRYLRQKDR